MSRRSRRRRRAVPASQGGEGWRREGTLASGPRRNAIVITLSWLGSFRQRLSSRQASRGSGVVEPATVEGETGVCFIAFACERGRRWAVQGESDVQRSRKQTPRRRGVFSCITSVQGCAASRRASGGVFSGDRVEYLLQAPRYNRIASSSTTHTNNVRKVGAWGPPRSCALATMFTLFWVLPPPPPPPQ